MRERAGDRACPLGIRWARVAREQAPDERVETGDDRDARAAHVIGAAASEEDEPFDRDIRDAAGPEVSLKAKRIQSCADRWGIAEALREATLDAPVPVVLIADQVALVVARLDHHETPVVDDHEGDALPAVARRVPREDDAVLGQPLPEVKRDMVGEACARIRSTDD